VIAWTHSYANTSLLANSYYSDFTIDINSNIYFSGTCDGSADYDYKMVKLTKNGVLVYNVQYNTGAGKDEVTFKIAASNAGELFILGDFDNYIPVRDFVSVVKFNAAGAFQWGTNFHTTGPNAYYAMDIQVGPDGHPVAVGDVRDFYNVNPSGETVRIKVAKFNGSTGAELFDVTPDDATYSNPDLLERSKCMTIDPFNNIYIGGSSNVYAGISVQPYRWLALKVIGATGLREWVEAGVGDDDPLNEMADVTVTAAHDSYWAGSEKFSGNVNMWITKYCEVGCFSPRLGTTENTSSLLVYPNPSATSFTINNNEENSSFTLSVYDITGKLVEEHNSVETTLQFGENLSPGIYFARYVNATENKTLRIIKTQ
jgi:hypothetical protein